MQVDHPLRTKQHPSRPLFDSLQQQLAQLRVTLVHLKGQDPVPLEQLHSLLQQLLLLTPNIEQYVGILRESVQLVEEGRSEESIFAISLEGLGQRVSISLYLWQLFNFLCIHGLELPPQLDCLVLPLLKAEAQFQNIHSPNSLKNALIFIYNSMVKEVKKRKERNVKEINEGNVKKVKAKESNANEPSCLLKMVSLVIMNNFQRGQLVRPRLLELFPIVKTEEHFVSEMEWVGYISMLLFSNEANRVREDSLVQQLVEVSSSGRMLYYCLHLMGSYFENMVNNRVTTELVTGFECQIPDVKEMYQKDANNVTEVRISQRDLEYILECYKHHLTEYRHIVREYLLLKLQKEQKEKNVKHEDQLHQEGKQEKYQKKMRSILERWTGNAEVLNETAHLLNSLLFIGGYNNQLQTVVTLALLGTDSLLLLHLELSYLLYRNLQSSRFKTKMKMMVDMEVEVKVKLLAATSLNNYPAEDIEVKDLCLDEILAEGQLVLLLRLLTNLVHINHAAQVPFERERKYMHIILSLTHDNASQVTMKEWAIMFIRNVAEGSLVLREQIGKTKFQMKVE